MGLIDKLTRYFFLMLAFIVLIGFNHKVSYAQDYWTTYQAGPILKVASARMTSNSEEVLVPADDAEIGYQFGGFFRMNVDKIYVQVETLYSKIQTQLVFLNYDDIQGFNPRAEFEFNTLEFPINIGYRIGNLRLQTGPSISTLISGNRSFLNEIENITSEYNRVSLMWHMGVGGDFDRFMVDVRYEAGLSKTGESLSNLLGRDFVPRQRLWVVSVGLNFLR